MLANEGRGLLQAANRVLRLAAADGGGANNEGAIRDGFGNCFEFRGLRKQRRSSDSGTCLAKSQFVGIHHAKMEKAEVTHGAGRRANVERIARGDKDNPHAIGFGIR
jgi:hypothetical protein